MTKQKEFLKDVTDNTVKSILHPKKYIRERKEARGKLLTKPYIPTSGPDKWIDDLLKKSSNYNAKQSSVKSKDAVDPSYFEKVAKDWELSYPNPIRMAEDLFMPPNKKTQEYLDSKKNSNVTPKQTYLKPKTQVTTSTKPTTTVNDQKPKTQVTTPTKQNTTAKFKEEVKTEPKQTYLKPKGEVNMKVKLFQKMLLDEGMDLGKEGADGIWGKNTQAAFEKLQANKANYTIAMEKFKQLDEELQPKTIQTPQPFLPPRFSPASPTTLPAFKKGGKMEFIYLQKGGKINGKVNPNDGDENAIPTKEEGGTDMNPKFTKKLKPKQTTKPSPIYKPKAKTEKVEEKKKGGKMRKKCSCGCAMKISKNAKGGLIEKCSCGCKN